MPVFYRRHFTGYVPGKLLLIALKRTLSPLEDVTLACFLGLVVSGLVYWLIAFAHQARFLFRLAAGAAAVFVWLHGSKTKITVAPFHNDRASVTKRALTVSCDRSVLPWPELLRLGLSCWRFCLFITRISRRGRMAQCASIRCLTFFCTSRSRTN